MTPPILRTARLELSPYVPDDEEAFVRLFQDERVSRWVGDGPDEEAEDRALFHRIFGVYEQDEFDVWAVRQDGMLVGHAEIKPTEVSGGHEIIYVLAHKVWGRGLGTELARALTEYGFEHHGLDAVHATVAAPNAASLAVLGRLGYRPVRQIPQPGGEVVVLLSVDRGVGRRLIQARRRYQDYLRPETGNRDTGNRAEPGAAVGWTGTPEHVKILYRRDGDGRVVWSAVWFRATDSRVENQDPVIERSGEVDSPDPDEIAAWALSRCGDVQVSVPAIRRLVALDEFLTEWWPENRDVD